MKITFIRHAEPDYENNTLTKKGFEEAELLGKHFPKNDKMIFFCSPLNRALLTIKSITTNHKVYDWLKEFDKAVKLPYDNDYHCTWNFMPSYYVKENNLLYDNDYLDKYPLNTNPEIKQYYQEIISNFDKLLENYGYKRDGKMYTATKSNDLELVFVCHFGLISVLMSHLINVPYTLLACTFFCPPTGIVRFISEEREKQKAIFRCVCYGDTTHLNIANHPISSSGRFQEIYKNK